MATDRFTTLLMEMKNLDADLEAPDLKYKVSDLLSMVYETVSAMHVNQQKSDDQIEKLKKVINADAAGGFVTGDKHRKGILEYKVIQNIKPLTGDKSQFRQWHQKLINALSTVTGEHADVIKEMEKMMDVGETIEDVIKDLDNNYDTEDMNRDLQCILVDKCEGRHTTK